MSPEQRAMWAYLAAAQGGGDGFPLRVESFEHRLVIDIRGRVDEARLSRALNRVLTIHHPMDSQQSGPIAAPWMRARLHQVEHAHWRWTLGLAPLAADQGSFTVLFHALAESYARDEPAALVEEGISYAQFVQWRRELEADESAATGRAWWESSLATGASEPPSFPQLACRLPRVPGVVVQSRERVVHSLDNETINGLERVAFTSRMPVDVVLQAAWWGLLARITGQSAFTAGWQLDCRFDYAHFANTVGVFEKVLPLGLTPWPEERFSTWLERFAHLLDNARQWQEWWPVDEPLETTHQAVGFALARRPAVICVSDASEWSVEDWPTPMPVFELALQAELEATGRLSSLSVHYARDAYDPHSMRTLLDQYVTLLKALPDRADAEIRALPIMSAAERAAVLSINQPAMDVGGQSVPELIAQWALRAPHAAALVSNEQTLSYAQLEARVLQLAHWLKQQGAERDVPVALCMNRSVELVIALLAVMRTGGAYLPLDPQWPVERRKRILAVARPLLILTDEAPLADVSVAPGAFGGQVGGTRCVGVHELLGELRQFSPGTPLPPVSLKQVSLNQVSLNQAAYILFTSGSTGEPKGVVIEHGQLLNYVAAVSRSLDLGSCKRFALTSTVAADLGNTTLFGALFNGASLIIASAMDMQDGASFARFLQHHEVDCLKIVPSHLAALMDTNTPVLPRTLILGGESTPRTLAEKVYQLAPDCRIYNHYGPTETTVGVLTHAVDMRSLREAGASALPLTHTTAGSQAYLLDAAGQLAPIGLVGELHIGGAQVFRGYLAKPDASQLVSYPHISASRLYRTGDLARYLPQGGLQLIGRADTQIKVRGFRIEPAEVEAALMAQPRVREAVTDTCSESSDNVSTQLVAYVVFYRRGQQWDSFMAAEEVSHLRRALLALLPEPMVPTHIYNVRALPRLPNGKIDRRALRALRQTTVQDSYEAPRDSVEAVLASQMAMVLGRERLGVSESFLQAGGNSLLVIKLVARIRRLFEVEIPPGIVFDHPTPAELAVALRGREQTPGELEHRARMQQQLALSEAVQ